jgi:hypothetical protein
MKPGDFTKQNYVDFMNWSISHNTDFFGAFTRYMFDLTSKKLDCALDESEIATKKYFDHAKKILEVQNANGIEAAAKMIGESKRLEANMYHWDAEVHRLEKMQDKLTEKWERG